MTRLWIAAVLLLTQGLAAQTTLRFADSNFAPERIAVIRYILDAFELYHPDIRVEMVLFDENDGAEELLAREEPLHLIMADSSLIGSLERRDALSREVPTAFIRRRGEDSFYKGALEAFGTAGRYGGVPFSAWLQVLWYRKDWFEEAGLAPPDSPEALRKAARYFRRRGERSYGIVMGTGRDVYTRQCFLQLAGAFGLAVRRDRRGPYLERPVLLRALDYYRDLAGATPPGVNSWRYRDYYFQGRAAMLLYSTHLMDDLAVKELAEDSLGPENFADLEGRPFDPELLAHTGMVTAITGEKPSSYGSVSGVGIFRSPDPAVQEAQEALLRFLFREDVYMTWLHMSPGGMLPVWKPAVENDGFYRDLTGVLKAYGRERVQQFTQGLEFFQVIRPEELAAAPGGDYGEKGLRELVGGALESPRRTEELLEGLSWVR